MSLDYWRRATQRAVIALIESLSTSFLLAEPRCTKRLLLCWAKGAIQAEIQETIPQCPYCGECMERTGADDGFFCCKYVDYD